MARPSLHIGGSGTFYPDTESSNDLSCPGCRTGCSLGLFPASMADAQEFTQVDLRCNLSGFEGAFFGADVVEGYPRGYRLEIPLSADYIIADVNDSVLAESPGSDSILVAVLRRDSYRPL
ncbi:DNA repair protein [Diplocarpon rosae]|nr:DNA repair protein [Diplocarpon rosae]